MIKVVKRDHFNISVRSSRFIFITWLLIIPFILSAQHYYRIRADFTFKFLGGNEGNSSLVIGTAYFDKIDQKITYQVRFPAPQVWVMHDTTLFKFENGALISKNYIPSPVETSIFNLALQSSMSNFALESSAYTLENVEEDKGMVIATWAPPRVQGNDKLGKVLIANQNGLLTGIIFNNGAGEIIAKQFYDKYELIGGINFPKEVTQIYYSDGKESYQVTNYKNIVIDESGKDHLYRYPVN